MQVEQGMTNLNRHYLWAHKTESFFSSVGVVPALELSPTFLPVYLLTVALNTYNTADSISTSHTRRLHSTLMIIILKREVQATPYGTRWKKNGQDGGEEDCKLAFYLCHVAV